MRFLSSILINVMVLILLSCQVNASPIQFKVMTFNIENGGTQVDFNKVVEAIKLSGAHAVGIQEAWGHTPRLAQALGWKYYNPSQNILSRYPLLAPDEQNRYTFIELAPGKVVAMANMHLPDPAYGPEDIEAGTSAKQAVKDEQRFRVPMALVTINKLVSLAKQGIPVFLTGDFNSPSDLDWTESTVHKLPEHRFKVIWPVTRLLHDRGLYDSFRTVYPSPLKTPGFTWPSGRPFIKNSIDAWNPSPKDAQDRLDFIFSGGAAKPIESQVIGELSKQGSLSVSPWPSDHRAVVSTFLVTPVTPPIFVTSLNKVNRIGLPVEVYYHSPAVNEEKIIVSSTSESKLAPGQDGRLTFSTTNWTPGHYNLLLVDKKGNKLASSSFWMIPANAIPKITVSPNPAKTGQPVTITWSYAPGNRLDYLRINPVGSKKLAWGEAVRLYLHSQVNGQMTYDPKNVKGNWLAWHVGEEGKWPLSPGRYEINLMLDDGFTQLASTLLTITP